MLQIISRATRALRLFSNTNGPEVVRNRMNDSASSFVPSVQDVLYIKSLLLRRIPTELIDLIIDFAEYWPRHITEVEEVLCVGNSSTFLYLRSQPLPGTFVPEGPQDGEVEGGILVGGVHTRTLNPARRIIFRIWSHDQGWSSNHGRGTYEDSYSWFESFPERPQTIAAAQEATPLLSPVNITSEGSLQELQSESWRSVAIPEARQNDSVTEDVVMKETWQVQCNVHADSSTKKHEVIWTWTDTEGEIINGAGRGGDFVRCLKPGDRISVIAKAMYPGWQNNVEKMQVEVYYAV